MRQFEDQMSQAIKWKEQFGHGRWAGNYYQLADVLEEFPFGPSAQIALVLSGFHHFVAKSSRYARALLDIFEVAARRHLMWGNFLVVLVKTDDANYSCENLGCHGVNWCPPDWGTERRGDPD